MNSVCCMSMSYIFAVYILCKQKSRESKDTGEGSITFGSHQAILVANQEAKATLPTVFKENANVLTICECKGLEFDDVLLYKDSQVQ